MNAEEQTHLTTLKVLLDSNEDHGDDRIGIGVVRLFIKQLEAEKIEYAKQEVLKERDKWNKILQDEVETAHNEGQGYVIRLDNLNHGRHPIAGIGYFEEHVRPKYQ